MDNFDWTAFSKKIAVNTTVQTLYNAWTVPAELEKWFLEKARFEHPNGHPVSMLDHISPKDTYQWSWYLYDVIEKGEILEANGRDALAFTFAGDCVVTVQLIKQSNSVLVELIQRDIPTDAASKQHIRLGCASGWSFFLTNLKSVYEGGIDLRNKDDKLKGLLNN